MKTSVLIIIASIVLVSMVLVVLDVPEASAKCIDRDNCPRPLGSSSLKEQIKQYDMVRDIKCMKQEHWLVERPNGKLACVTASTEEKLGWNALHYSMADSKENVIVTSGVARIIPYEIMGATLEDFSYQDNVFTATIKPHAQYNVLSLMIKDEMLNINPDQCDTIHNNTPSLSYVISVNGEEMKTGASTNFSRERVVNIHTTENVEMIGVIGLCKDRGLW